MSSSSSSRIAIVSSPGCLTAIPSAIVPRPVLPACTPTMLTPGRSARSAIAIPAASPPPPTGSTNVADVRQLGRELEPDRALARDHALVLERVHERRAGLLGARERRGERLVEARAGSTVSAP